MHAIAFWPVLQRPRGKSVIDSLEDVRNAGFWGENACFGSKMAYMVADRNYCFRANYSLFLSHAHPQTGASEGAF